MTEKGIDAAELLLRIAATVKSEIAPAVGDEYIRTQAFMASVIIERIAKQVSLAPRHAQAELDDLAALFGKLSALLVGAPPPVADALQAGIDEGAVTALGPLIEALYGWGIEGGEAAAALAAIRVALRNDIDRRMEIAT